MTQERRDHISFMLRNIYPVFQGVIGVVNQPSNDGTYEVLEENKGDGLIIKRPWVYNHGYLMNELLFSRKIKNNQWCLYLDSPQSCTDKFIEIIPSMLEKFDKEGIGALFWEDRAYFFKFHEYLEFYGAYHWGLNNIIGKIITIPNQEDYIINKRKETPEVSWCFNPIKSYISYPLSNECVAMYSKYGDAIWKKHEMIRRSFRTYLQEKLNLNLNSLDDLINYMKKIESKEIIPDDYFVETVQNEFRLSELYQLKVLNYNFMGKRPDDPIGMHPRYEWSFRNHLQFKNGWIDENYKGTVLRYDDGIFS
jgi:hypothetical protein